MAATTASFPGGAFESFSPHSAQIDFGSTIGVSEQRYDNHMNWDGPGAWFMISMMAVFWLGVVALGWWAIASYNRRHEGSRETALEVAKHRYARGEVTAEEFERLKRDLG